MYSIQWSRKNTLQIEISRCYVQLLISIQMPMYEGDTSERNFLNH